MNIRSVRLPALIICALPGSVFTATAAITSVVETGLTGEVAAIIGPGFGEDVLTFSDRQHQHNGAAFNSGTGLLSTTGDLIVPLPGYLTGGSYVLFANDARDNANYYATITADVPTTFYLLVDNRLNGPTGAGNHPNTDDPVLGGTLQWVTDGGWIRVNTGISPNGQADYTGVDEAGATNGTADQVWDSISFTRSISYPLPRGKLRCGTMASTARTTSPSWVSPRRQPMNPLNRSRRSRPSSSRVKVRI